MRAINATVMRQINRTLILNQIRLRPISRAELAEETGLTRASVTQIVEELISDGIVIETAMIGRSRLGRRSTQLAIDARSGMFFGVHLEREQCSVGVINMRGEVLRQSIELTFERPATEVLGAIADTILKQKTALRLDDARICGIGITVPGPVNPETGCMLTHDGFSAWQNIPVAEMLSKRTGFPVWLETAANAQALDEKYFGTRGENFILVRVSESISTGAIVRGELYRGAPDFVVQLGNCPADSDKKLSLNQLIAVPALLRDTPWRRWSDLLQHESEPEAEQVIDRMVPRLAAAIINLIHAFSIDRVMLAGDLCGASDLLLTKINHAVRTGVHYPITHALVSTVSESNPVRIGASPAFHNLFKIDLKIES